MERPGSRIRQNLPGGDGYRQFLRTNLAPLTGTYEAAATSNDEAVLAQIGW